MKRSIIRPTQLPAEAALAGEIAMLDAVSADPNRALWGLWQSPQSLVAPNGFHRKPGMAQACAMSADRGWPVASRCTGGDVTPQGVTIANVTLCYALPQDHAPNIAATFDMLCAPVFDLLGPRAGYGFVDGAFCDGAYNITCNGLKFAGTAQRFRRCAGDASRIAVLSHAIFVLAVPTAACIEAINAFLADLGEPRTIQRSRHIGLPDGITAPQFYHHLWAGHQQQFPALKRVGQSL